MRRRFQSIHDLSDSEKKFSHLIKHSALSIIAIAVVYLAMDRLESILIPFLLAVALSYLLSPLVDLLSCRNQQCSCKLPRGIAVMIAFLVGCLILSIVGLVLLKALTTFQAWQDKYRHRMEELLEGVFRSLTALQVYIGSRPSPAQAAGHGNHSALMEAQEMVNSFLEDVSVTGLIGTLLGTAAHVVEDVMYIVLFLVFLLAHAGEEPAADAVAARVNNQIFIYIRGKSSISAFVGGMHAAVLWSVGLDGLWLPFGVLTFFLNFIPNVGGMGAVLLPLPLIALDDEKFTSTQSLIAFIVPFIVNIFAKDVLEPNILGHATDLHPVAILLAILIFNSVWGITGMVMAVPLTAVLRICLESMNHPIPQFVARKLAGGHATQRYDPNGDDASAIGKANGGTALL